MKTSEVILNEFLIKYNIKIKLSNYIKTNSINESSDIFDLPDDIVEKIISDAFIFSYKIIQKISDELFNKFNIHLSRIQKRYLKSYLIFRSNYSFLNFKNSLNGKVNDDLILYIEEFISQYNLVDFNEVNIFIENLSTALNNKNNDRVKDYLIFLYSRLLAINEKRKITLWQLFIENELDAKKVLTDQEFNKLLLECQKVENIKEDKENVVYKFNKIYNNILNEIDLQSTKYQVIYIEIDQEFVNKFNSLDELTLNINRLLYYSYSILENHKSLIFRIKNVCLNKVNIKWHLYSIITINSHNIKKEITDRSYYKPEIVANEILQKIFNLKLNDNDLGNIGNYYITSNDNYLKNISNLNNEIAEVIKSLKWIYYGLSFIDCFVLKTNNEVENTSEINFIENQNEILLIFQKHELDKRKIPCPVCGSLKISGNSYPEIGVKSWECKNPNCFERSKTNRGKRFSAKSNFMQDEFTLSDDFNYINKDLINVFRKDVVENWNDKDLFSMIIKFYSYSEDKLLFLNSDSKIFIENNHKRKIDFTTIDSILISQNKANIGNDLYFDNVLSKCIFHTPINETLEMTKMDKYYSNNLELIRGDSLKVLQNMNINSIHHMVTSPPYYNAREYSTWTNIYTYLNDMYKIIKECYRVMIEGGTFFFNIGDIFDNDNTITKSTLGNNRVPLGAYTIYIFEKAGFELLDNIIWFKGEPQSNRHKNDGMYFPYYQRPANAYEHIFIFKKPGKLYLNIDFSQSILKNNIQKFSPVIKIGSNGVNRYGHTAPFPEILPKLSILSFTNIGDKVLDPFSGSGTVPIVAKQLKRHGIGIELNHDYYQLSKEKCESANNLNLFE